MCLQAPKSTEIRIGIFSNNNLAGELPAFVGSVVNSRFDFSGNNFSNGCDEIFEELNACNNVTEVAPTPAPEDAPAPAPTDVTPQGEGDGGGGGISGGAIAGIIIVLIIFVSIGAYFGYKKWSSRKTQGSFEKFQDSNVQLSSTSQSYNPQLEP